MVDGYELRAVMGENIERMTIGMVVYKDQASLQQLNFMSNSAVLTFFGTFDFDAVKFTSAL